MKIAIITSPFGYLPPCGYGAVETRWYYVGEELASQGNEVTIYGKANADYNPQNVVIHGVKGFKRTNSIYGDIVKDFVYTLKACFKMKHADVVVQNTFWAPILCPLFRWKYKKAVYNVARMPRPHFKLYKGVSLFSCVSKAAEMKTREILGVKRNITTVNNPVNISNFTEGTRPPRDVITIGYHGRVHPEKGLHLLFEAAEKLAATYPIELQMVGPQAVELGGGGALYISKLEQLLDKCSVKWIPPTSSQKELNDFLHKCDIYCYPSVAEKGETFGVAPLEAMATGCPVVVSSLECFQDFVEDKVTGLVFNHRASDAVRLLINELQVLIESSDKRAVIGRAGAKRAKDFAVANIAAKYAQVFNSLLAGDKFVYDEKR